MTETGRGVVAVLGAAVIWGLSPVFYNWLAHVPALEVLSHRMIWSMVFFAALLAVQGRLAEIPAVFKDRRTTLLIVLAAMVIAVNWALFIWAVQVGKTTQSSLGYYIYPLLSVLLGRMLFAEKLALAQSLAIGLVTVAVCLLTLGESAVPWVALALASSFAVYGLVKKQLGIGPVVSVTVEVMLVCPLAVVFLLADGLQGAAAPQHDPLTWALLVLAGPMTALPLFLFGYGARRMRMASAGLIMYLNPTLQFAVAVFVFSEPFSRWHLVAFVLIWTALALYSTSAWRQEKARRTAARQVSASGTIS